MSELDSARRLIARGKSEQAARLLAELIAEHPGNKDAWLLMAKAVKDPQQKLDCFQRLLEIDPEDRVAQKGILETEQRIFISRVKKQVEQSRSKTAREKRTKTEQTIRVTPFTRFLKTKYLFPAIFFILVSTIAFLVLKNRPARNDAFLTATPAVLSQVAQAVAHSSTPVPSEDPKISFISLPYNIYFSQNGKLWLWRNDVVKSLSDIDPVTPIIANGQSGQVLFTLHGNLLEVDPVSVSIKELVNANSMQQGTPLPTSSVEAISAVGIVPVTNNILFSTKPGEPISSLPDPMDLFIVQADGSEITQLLDPEEGGVPYSSPDGKWLAVVNSGSIRLLSLSNRAILDVLDFAAIPASDGYMLPTPQWAADSSRFMVVIPPTDFANDLNAATAIWQVTNAGQKTAYPSAQSRGGAIIVSADLQFVIYQLNLSTVSDTFGEIHRVNIDGSRDAILFGGQLAHLIGLDASGEQAIFQFQDSPNPIRMEDTGTLQSHVILEGLDADTLLSLTWMDDQTFLYQTAQTDTVRLWLAKFDGTTHAPLLLAENPARDEIPFCFTKK